MSVAVQPPVPDVPVRPRWSKVPVAWPLPATELVPPKDRCTTSRLGAARNAPTWTVLPSPEILTSPSRVHFAPSTDA